MFLEDFRRHAFLYDKKEALYKNTNVKKNIWRVIGKKHVMSGIAIDVYVFYNMQDPYSCGQYQVSRHKEFVIITLY